MFKFHEDSFHQEALFATSTIQKTNIGLAHFISIYVIIYLRKSFGLDTNKNSYEIPWGRLKWKSLNLESRKGEKMDVELNSVIFCM